MSTPSVRTEPMTVRSWRSVHLLGFLVVLASLGTISCQDQDDIVAVIPGDVMIAAILEVNNVHEGQCGTYSADSIQEILALTWFVDSLNEMNYVQGVKIGLEAYRTCGLTERASKAAVKLIQKYVYGTPAPLLGIVGPGRTSEVVAMSSLISSLPSDEHVLQISGGATGRQLSDKTRFPNFFRVIPPDDIQIQVMLKLMMEMEWNYVAIVYDNDDYGLSAATQLRSLAEENHICVPVFESLPLEAASSEFVAATGNIVTQIKNSPDGLVRGMVVIGSSYTASQLLNVLDVQAAFVQLIMSEAVGLQTAPFTQKVSRGSLVTSPPYLPMPEFTSFWNALWANESSFNANSARLPWLQDYLEEVAKCQQPGGTAGDCWNSAPLVRESLKIPAGMSEERVSLFVGYTLKAAAVLAEVLRRLQEEKCQGTSACNDLMDSVRGRKDVLNAFRSSSFSFSRLANISQGLADLSDVSFDASGEVFGSSVKGSKYGVYNLQKPDSGDFLFQQVGTFSPDQQLSLNKSLVKFYHDDGTARTWGQVDAAQCDADHNCQQCERDLSESVIFIPGDFYIVAIVPVHSKNPIDLLQCGQIKSAVGADMAQAVIFAVGEVNKKSGAFLDILPGRKVGLVGISSCGSELLIRHRVMDFFSGRLVLPDGRNSSVLLDKFMGVLGAYYSANSIAASDTLTTLGRPFVQVSPGSTSPDLKDRTKHPYFMRLVPADDKQAGALLEIAQKLGANYIQVIYDGSTSYATGLFLKIQEAASAPNNTYNVCIAQSIVTTPRPETSQYKYIVDKLRDKSAARIIIVILHFEEAIKVMNAVLPLLKVEDDFLFLASEAWGRRQQIIDGRTGLQGSLVLTQEIAVDQVFEKYFAALDPTAPSTLNPWLQFFWEVRLHCYFPNSFERKGKKPCEDDLVGNDYVQDSRVPFHIQTVYALVKGFHEALTQHCGSDARRTCAALTSARLVSAMKNVKLDLYNTSREALVFDDNGEGMVGYKVLRIDPTSSGTNVMYNEIGQWTTAGLVLKKSDVRSVSSVCPNSAECDACFSAPVTSKGNQCVSDDDESGTVAAIVVGVLLSIIIIVLVVFIVYLIRRQKLQSDAMELKRQQNFQMAQAEENYSFCRDSGHYYSTPSHLNLDIQRRPLPTPTADPQPTSNPLSTSDLQITSDPPSTSDPQVTSDPTSTSDQQVTSDPPPTSDPAPCRQRPKSDYLTPVDDTLTTFSTPASDV